MHGRLADILLYLSDDSNEKYDLFNYLSRKDIADFACISTESTVRILTEFKNDNIIETDGKDIHILDKKRLLEISKNG
jgi:CRP/FNR family transcriptional regulator